jgi:hypothetical protein
MCYPAGMLIPNDSCTFEHALVRDMARDRIVWSSRISHRLGMPLGSHNQWRRKLLPGLLLSRWRRVPDCCRFREEPVGAQAQGEVVEAHPQHAQAPFLGLPV